MADIQINIHRLAELHGNLERARAKLAAVRPHLSVDAAGSWALPEFEQRIIQLAEVVDLYAARVEEDSRTIYQVSTAFMDKDDALAKEYARTIGSGLSGEGEASWDMP